MPQRRVLFFDGNNLTALRWHGGHTVDEGCFKADPVGLEALADYLRRHSDSLFYLLADISEEGFQLETVPYVQGADRAALLKRRLGQFYYGTPLATAISLGRNKDGRRDEVIQFVALTRSEMFAPWLETIQTAAVPLVGVYSVPLVLSKLPLDFAKDHARFLFGTFSSGGFRQTYFNNGQMHFSRLASIGNGDARGLAQACATETAKTVQYLVGQRQLTRGARLTAFVLSHPDHLQIMRDGCPNTVDIDYQFIDISRFGSQLKYKTAAPGDQADGLLAHLMLIRPPGDQFAAPAQRHTYRLWQTRFSLRVVAIAALLGSLTIAGRQMLQVQDFNDQHETLQSQTRLDTQRYQSLLADLPKIPLSADNLRAVLAKFEELEARSPEAKPLLAHLGKTLEIHPGIEIDQLRWQISEKPPETKAGAGGTAPATAPAVNAPADGVWTMLEVQARLPFGLISDQRGQLTAIDQLATELRTAGVSVEVLSTPVNVESAKALRSDEYDVTTSRAGDIPRLGFALRLTRLYVAEATK
jgi:hypothetical protein